MLQAGNIVKRNPEYFRSSSGHTPEILTEKFMVVGTIRYTTSWMCHLVKLETGEPYGHDHHMCMYEVCNG